MIFLNGYLIKPTIFPDKTSQVWKIGDDAIHAYPGNQVEWRFEHEGEFMHLAQLRALLADRPHLYIPYLPYARQDKAVGNNTTFALLPFLRLLDGLDFGTVAAFDPHNAEFARTYLRNFVAIEPKAEIQFAIYETRPDLLCYPDEGAKRRYEKWRLAPEIWAEKDRDQASGEILGVRLNGAWEGKTILIVDDLCDGGATFIKLAAALKGAADIHLYVSHGLFSKGIDVLRQGGIRRIFTKEGEVQ